MRTTCIFFFNDIKIVTVSVSFLESSVIIVSFKSTPPIQLQFFTCVDSKIGVSSGSE